MIQPSVGEAPDHLIDQRTPERDTGRFGCVVVVIGLAMWARSESLIRESLIVFCLQLDQCLITIAQTSCILGMPFTANQL